MSEKKELDDIIASKVSGGETKEEYYKTYKRLGLIDSDPPAHNGDGCRYCNFGKIRFWRFQPGPFGNKESVYSCDSCHEYVIYAVEE